MPQEITTGLVAVRIVKEALNDEGLSRISKFNGGELTGWTNDLGATGFSIRKQADGTLQWNTVISGRPHLIYEHDEEDSTSRPVNPEYLCPKIKKVFESIGLKVKEVRAHAWQTMWDDDIDYLVVTEHPEWLEPFAPKKRHEDVFDLG
jgi:hypothetical protein